MASTKGAGSASAPNDDSDLEDLIAKSPSGKNMANVEIDSGGGGDGGDFLSVTPLGFISGSIRLCCYRFPCLSKCVGSILILAMFSLLSYTVFSPTREMGIMGADYSAITSAYDLSLSKVDHWCIQGDNDSCRCEDPLEANSRSEFKSWNVAHRANVADIELYRSVYGSPPTMIDEATGKSRPPIDVAFLGESVVEAMDGRWLGKRIATAMGRGGGKGEEEGPEAKKNNPDIGKVFEKLFRKEKGGPVEGVALGIAGDNTANVLWRLQHDEMPYDFNPKVWWLVLGMNDLTRMQCSEEIVVLGILRVVEEIRLRKPDAHIVINSLLPMIDFGSSMGGKQPHMSDFADFAREKDKMRESMEIDRAKKFFGLKEESPPPRVAEPGNPDSFKEHGWHRTRNLKRHHKRRRHKRGDDDEDDEAEGTELKEAMDWRKDMLARADKHMRGKVFADDEKYRPTKPLSPFLPMIKKHHLPPVWPSVHLINAKLKEFCTKHEYIMFFDATSVFAEDEGGGRHRLRSELISPRGHPSELGFAVWEGQIMGRLHKLLADRARIRAPAMADDDDGEVVEDSGIVELDPMHSVDEEDDDDGDADGTEHVSHGKESDPPPEVDQPSRDELDEDEGGDDEIVSAEEKDDDEEDGEEPNELGEEVDDDDDEDREDVDEDEE